MARTAVIFIALTLAASGLAPASKAERQSRIPVLVELFTSEGCSSCPPADRVLQTLLERQPVPGVEIVGLSEHVDYWNHLGWSDPYSGAAFTARQREYARSLEGGGLYTPQLVVDGSSALVGSDRVRVESAIARAGSDSKQALEIRVVDRAGGRMTLEVRVAGAEARGHGTGEVVLAVTENHLASSVAAGENRGLKLTHAAVVRRLIDLGRITGADPFLIRREVALEAGWKRGNLRVVVFVQDVATRRILGVTSTALD